MSQADVAGVAALAPETPRSGSAFVFEKWYIDVLTPEGTVLLLYLGRIRLLGVEFARVTADLFLPDSVTRRGSATADHVSRGPGRLSFGPACIAGDDLEFATDGLSGRLRFVPRYPQVALADPFLARGARRLLWEVEIPDADVSGSVYGPWGSRPIVGRGYRDRVWSDFLPWRLPLRQLVWGRAWAGDHATTWVKATTTSGKLSLAWLDGYGFETIDDDVSLGPSSTLVDADVVDLEGLRLGVLRPVLRRLTRDPHETKWAAPATVMGEKGRAIHEVVRWR